MIAPLNRRAIPREFIYAPLNSGWESGIGARSPAFMRASAWLPALLGEVDIPVITRLHPSCPWGSASPGEIDAWSRRGLIVSARKEEHAMLMDRAALVATPSVMSQYEALRAGKPLLALGAGPVANVLESGPLTDPALLANAAREALGDPGAGAVDFAGLRLRLATRRWLGRYFSATPGGGAMIADIIERAHRR